MLAYVILSILILHTSGFVDLIQKDVQQDVLFSVSDTRIVFLRHDHTVDLFDLSTYTIEKTLAPGIVHDVAVTNNTLAIVSENKILVYLRNDNYTTVQEISVPASSIKIAIDETTTTTLGVLVNNTSLDIYSNSGGTFTKIQTLEGGMRSFTLEQEFLLTCDISTVTLLKYDGTQYINVRTIGNFNSKWGVSSQICNGGVAIGVRDPLITLEEIFVDVFIPDTEGRGGVHFIQITTDNWHYHQRLYGSLVKLALGQSIGYAYPYLLLGAPSFQNHQGGWELFDCSGLCTKIDGYLDASASLEIGDVVGVTKDHVVISGNNNYLTRVYEIFTTNTDPCPPNLFRMEEKCIPCSELKTHFNELKCCKLTSTSHQNAVCEELGVACKVCEYLWQQYHDVCNSCRSTTTCELDQDCVSKNCVDGNCV